MNYEIRWAARTPDFTLLTPWWLDRFDPQGQGIIVAAIRAESPAAALAAVVAAHTDPALAPVSLLACDERPADWVPFGGRRVREGWMQW